MEADGDGSDEESGGGGHLEDEDSGGGGSAGGGSGGGGSELKGLDQPDKEDKGSCIGSGLLQSFHRSTGLRSGQGESECLFVLFLLQFVIVL